MPRTGPATPLLTEPIDGWRLNALLFAGAALPRLLYLFLAPRRFLFEHWDMADSLLLNGTLGFNGVPTTRFEPLYPMFVALLRVATGHRVLLIQILQVLVGSLGAVFLFHLTKTLAASRRAAWFAAGLFAASPLLIRHAADGTDVTLMATLTIAFCLSYVRAASTGAAAVSGAMLGLATLTRAVALPIVPLAALLLVKERRPAAALACALGAVAVFAPYAIRNYMLNGAILPTRTGLNLLVSNSKYTQALVPDYHADLLEDYAESLLVRDGLGSEQGVTPALERQQDLALNRYAWTDMRQRPLELFTVRLKYAAYFLGPFLVPGYEFSDSPVWQLGDQGMTLSGFVRRPLRDRVAYTLWSAPILILAGWALVRRRRRVPREAILLCVAVTFVAAHSLYFPGTRYRVPLEFVLFYYAAVQLDALASRWAVSGHAPHQTA